MSNLTNNTTALQELLKQANALPDAGGGITPTGTVQITENGTFDVTEYASAEVNVPIPETVTQATPSITVSTSGLITASAAQTAGYVEAGTKSATKQLTTQVAKTVTPGTSDQTAVASGRYTTGAVTVKGDSNLVADNIKSGVSIFGVAGSYTGDGGSGSEDSCGCAEDLQYCVLSNWYFEDANVPAPMVVYFLPGWTWDDFVNSHLNKYVPGEVVQFVGGYRYAPYSAEPQPVALLTTKSDEVCSAEDKSYFLVTNWDEYTITLPSDLMIPGHTYHWS